MSGSSDGELGSLCQKLNYHRIMRAVDGLHVCISLRPVLLSSMGLGYAGQSPGHPSIVPAADPVHVH